MVSAENKATRLSQIEVLLLDHPEGLTQAEIARRLGVHRSTIHRNLADLIAPIYEDHRRMFIDREAYLINLRLTLHEAFSIHLAGRFMATCMDRRNPHIASAFRKLGISLDQLAPLLSEYVCASAEMFDDESKRNDPPYQQVMEKVTLAWSQCRKLKIWYKAANRDLIKEYLFCPYFVEVGAVGQAIYVIGQIEPQMEKRTFKLDRIVRIEILKETYTIPDTFDAHILLQKAWGVWFTDNEPQKIQLEFSARVAQRVRETRWHPTEQVSELTNGNLLWSAMIAEPREMMPWIRGWGKDVEVVSPLFLRNEIYKELEETVAQYNRNEQ